MGGLFNVKITSRLFSRAVIFPCLAIRTRERQVMHSKNLVSILRRDATFVGHAVIAVVFIAFASLAVAAALLDLISLQR